MATIPEQLSNILANSQGKTDANLAQDANNLGGLPAEDFATKEYVKKYHDTKESAQKEYIDNQDIEMLKQANEFANSLVRNQDFSSFAKLTDVQAVDTKLSGELTSGLSNQKAYTDKEIEKVVNDTNENFENVNGAISTLNGNMNNLFQSVSDGKSKIAGAITDKGVSTSATDTFDNMASNIRSIPTIGGAIPEGYIDTSSATASDSDLLLGKTAFAKGSKIIGTHICSGQDTSDATATPYDILTGKTAYNGTGKIEGVLCIDESSGTPSYSIGAVEKVYGTKYDNANHYTSNTSDNYSIFSKNAIVREVYDEKGNTFGNYLFDIDSTNNEVIIARREDTTRAYSSIQRFPLSEFELSTPVNNVAVTTATDTSFGGMGVSRLNILMPYLILATYSNSLLRLYTIPLEVNGNTDGNSGDVTLDIENKKISSDMEITTRNTFKIWDMQTTLDGERFALYNVSYDGSMIYYVDILIFNRNYILGADLLADKNVGYVGGNVNLSKIRRNFFVVDNNTFVCCNNIIIIKDDNTVVVKGINGNVKAISPDAKKVFIADCTIEQDSETSKYKWTYKYDIETISIDYIAGTITLEDLKEIPKGILIDIFYTDNNNSYDEPYFDYSRVIFLTNNILIISLDKLYFYSIDYDSSNILSIFKVEDGTLQNIGTPQNISLKTETVSSTEHRIYDLYDIISNTYSKVITYYAEKDFSKLIALKYNGELYYKNMPQSLTAIANDVREGKTFIGFNGQPETGTMVVETIETGGATNE